MAGDGASLLQQKQAQWDRGPLQHGTLLSHVSAFSMLILTWLWPCVLLTCASFLGMSLLMSGKALEGLR